MHPQTTKPRKQGHPSNNLNDAVGTSVQVARPCASSLAHAGGEASPTLADASAFERREDGKAKNKKKKKTLVYKIIKKEANETNARMQYETWGAPEH
jgi:hypothetical protein